MTIGIRQVPVVHETQILHGIDVGSAARSAAASFIRSTAFLLSQLTAVSTWIYRPQGTPIA